MNKKLEEHDKAIQAYLEQYKEDMKKLVQEGKLSHKNLEQKLTQVVSSVNREIRKITEELVSEEREEKKTKLAPNADKG